MTLGERIRQMRQKRKMTQTQLCGDTVTRNMLSQIENDAASPSVRTLEQFAERLGVSAGWLLCGDRDDLCAARAAFSAQDWREAIRLAEDAPEGAERSLLLAEAYGSAAQAAWERGDRFAAKQDAEKCLGYCGTTYERGQMRLVAETVLAQCALADGGGDAEMASFCRLCERDGVGLDYHLLSARYHLAQEHLQAAERDIWTMMSVPTERRGEYLLLRGRLALKQEKYGSAATFLRQAESAGVPKPYRRELYEQLSLTLRHLDLRGEAKKYADLAQKITFGK